MSLCIFCASEAQSGVRIEGEPEFHTAFLVAKLQTTWQEAHEFFNQFPTREGRWYDVIYPLCLRCGGEREVPVVRGEYLVAEQPYGQPNAH